MGWDLSNVFTFLVLHSHIECFSIILVSVVVLGV